MFHGLWSAHIIGAPFAVTLNERDLLSAAEMLTYMQIYFLARWEWWGWR
jgi:hypothetical protein